MRLILEDAIRQAERGVAQSKMQQLDASARLSKLQPVAQKVQSSKHLLVKQTMTLLTLNSKK